MRRFAVHAIALCAAGCVAAGDGTTTEYVPSADVRRLDYQAVDGASLAMIRDFDMAGSTLWLLDAGGRVVVVDIEGSRLRVIGEFGRKGPGPGELLQPTGVTLTTDGVAVIDGTRLHLFDRSGEFVSTRTIALPCPMMLPSVAAGRTGMFIAGSCTRRGLASDTVKAVLAWSRDTVAWQIVTESPRYTRDDSFGSAFGARSLLTTSAEWIHIFGGGETSCYWTIDDTGESPVRAEHCNAVSMRYRADPPPDLERRMRARGMRWPATLPAYVDRWRIDDEVVLLRPFSTDSVVIQVAGPGARDLVVAPLDGLLGCRADGCLWVRDDDPAGMIVLRAADVADRTRQVEQ